MSTQSSVLNCIVLLLNYKSVFSLADCIWDNKETLYIYVWEMIGPYNMFRLCHAMCWKWKSKSKLSTTESINIFTLLFEYACHVWIPVGYNVIGSFILMTRIIPLTSFPVTLMKKIQGRTSLGWRALAYWLNCLPLVSCNWRFL